MELLVYALAVAYTVCIYPAIYPYSIRPSADAATGIWIWTGKICLSVLPDFSFAYCFEFDAELRYYNYLHVSVVSSKSPAIIRLPGYF